MTQVTKTYKDMFDAAVHIGHRVRQWNPKMKKYLYGKHNDIHIINLEKTSSCLDEALKYLSKLKSEGKNILFVSTKPQSLKLIEEVAKKTNMPYVVSKWVPGLLTNFSTVKVRIKYLIDLESQEESGELEKYTKKEIAKLKKTMVKLQTSLGGVKNLKKLPDAVFVVDVVRDNTVVKEANTLKIPVVAILDSNANPNEVQYPIPANDDALPSLEYILGRIEQAIS